MESWSMRAGVEHGIYAASLRVADQRVAGTKSVPSQDFRREGVSRTSLARQNQSQQDARAKQQSDDDYGVQHPEVACMRPIGGHEGGGNKPTPASVCFIDNGFHAC
jgi:hypothetical protein